MILHLPPFSLCECFLSATLHIPEAAHKVRSKKWEKRGKEREMGNIGGKSLNLVGRCWVSWNGRSIMRRSRNFDVRMVLSGSPGYPYRGSDSNSWILKHLLWLCSGFLHHYVLLSRVWWRLRKCVVIDQIRACELLFWGPSFLFFVWVCWIRPKGWEFRRARRWIVAWAP